MKEYDKGGIKAPESESMVGAFRINWIKSCLLQPNSTWFHIPRSLFEKIGGLDFILKCEVNRISINSIYHLSAYIEIYADDTTMYVSAENVACINKLLQDELLLVSNWVTENRLKMNVVKTSIIMGSRYMLTLYLKNCVSNE